MSMVPVSSTEREDMLLQVLRIVIIVVLLSFGLFARADDEAAAQGSASSRPADATPAEALQRVVQQVELKGNLAEAIAKCGELADVQIQVDWSVLGETGVTEKTPVALKATEMTVEALLRLVLSQVAAPREPLTWYVSDGVINVTTQAKVLVHATRAAVARAVPQIKSQDVSGRGGQDGQGKSSPAIVRLRQGTVDVEYDEVQLQDIIEGIRLSVGVNIVVNWQSLAPHGVTRETPVTMKLSGVSMSTLLDVLTDDLSGGRDKFGTVYWLVDKDGMVRIATGSALNTTLDTRVVNVGDLLMLIPSFVGPRINLDVSAQSAELYEDNGLGGDVELPDAEEQLIELVKGLIGEDMWKPTGEGSVSILGDQMIITQSPLGFLLMSRQ